MQDKDTLERAKSIVIDQCYKIFVLLVRLWWVDISFTYTMKLRRPL